MSGRCASAFATASLALLLAVPASGQLVCVGDPPLRSEKGAPINTAEVDQWFSQVRAACEWGEELPWGGPVANLGALPTCNAGLDSHVYAVRDTGAGDPGIYQCDGTDWNAAGGGGAGSDDQTAAEVPIADAGAFYAGTHVEDALQEIGAGTTLDARYVNEGDDVDTDDQEADEVPYTPTTAADWVNPDPANVEEGLDDLAERLTDEEGKADDDVPEVGDFGAFNPSACPADQWVTDITAGALVCAQPSFANLSGSAADSQIPNDITINLATIATTATTANAGDSATAFFSAGTVEADRLPALSGLNGAVTDAQVPNTITVDLAAAATALAANGANCSAGQWAAGVDASGAAEGCTADDTGTDSADDLSDDPLGALSNVTETGEGANIPLVGDGAGAWAPAAAAACLENGTDCPADADTDDQVASEVPFTPAGTIAATDTQAAVAEAASEAAQLAGATFTGVLGVDNAQGFRLFEQDANGSNYVEFVAPAALTSNTTCTLENDGNPIPDSCVGDGTDASGGTPGGADTQVQYNDGGAFGGDAGLTYNQTTDVLTAGRFIAGAGSAAAPSLTAGANNAGWYEISGNNFAFANSGAVRFQITSSSVFSQTSGGFQIFYGAPTATSASVVPNRGDTDTSPFGYGGADDGRLIAGGSSVIGYARASSQNKATVYGHLIAEPQAATCADNGNGTAAALTLTPTSSRVHVTNSDAHGCDITMGETGMTSGLTVEVIVVSNAGGTVNWADSSGVQETPAAGLALALYDTATLGYISDRFVTLATVDN